MKQLANILAFFTVMMFLAPSCTKSLELDPVSQISSATFWKTEDDAVGGLNGMYVRLRAQAAGNFFLWGEARSEIMTRSLGGTAGYDAYYENALNTAVAGPSWGGLYTVIHDANLLLKYVPLITFRDEAKKNNILAQTYAMRAFVYFLMVKTWGDIPLISTPTESFSAEAIQKERSAKSEVFAFIKQDIEEAIRLFSNYTIPAGRNLWSKPSVNALKADVYLWTGKRLNGGDADLTTALNALEEVEKADVELLQNFADVFAYNNKGNKEILMAIRFQELESPETLTTSMYLTSQFRTTATDAATLAAIGELAGTGGPYWAPSEMVRTQFNDDDIRKKASFIEIYNYDPQGANPVYYGSVVSKFRGVISGGVRRFYDDVVLYRYADVLLMKAEVKNALGQDPSDEINLVRQRAYQSNYNSHVFVSGTREQNDEAILQERLFELIFEGKRWWDLIRFNKAFEKVPSLQNRAGQEYLLLFPISSSVLSLEIKVKQNEGY